MSNPNSEASEYCGDPDLQLDCYISIICEALGIDEDSSICEILSRIEEINPSEGV